MLKVFEDWWSRYSLLKKFWIMTLIMEDELFNAAKEEVAEDPQSYWTLFKQYP